MELTEQRGLAAQKTADNIQHIEMVDALAQAHTQGMGQEDVARDIESLIARRASEVRNDLPKLETTMRKQSSQSSLAAGVGQTVRGLD